jgi:hypothetical protein
VVVLYSEVNESKIDDIMTRFPKMHNKNDKQSFSFNEILFMGRRRDFSFHYQTKKMQRLQAMLSTRIQFNAKKLRK